MKKFKFRLGQQIPIRKFQYAIGLGFYLVCLGALAGEIAQSPLFFAPPVKPNIMLMMDNSGSMNNILVETDKADGYKPNVTYIPNCPAENLLAPCTKYACLEINIQNGSPVIHDAAGTYSLGINAGQKCFSSTLSYRALLYADGGSGTTPSYKNLDALYPGNYLNWYFNAGNTTPVWTNQPLKPGTHTRMDVAKAAGVTLVDTLDNVRMGLSAYYGSNGGSLLEIVGDVDLNTTKKTNIKNKINSLDPAYNTPLAETLSDIGQYFSTGYTGNLTLHPDTTKTPVSVSDVFTLGNKPNHALYNISGEAVVSPVQFSCQKNFAVLVTDGRPHFDRGVSASFRDYSGDCAAQPSLCDATPTADPPNAASGIPLGALTTTQYQNGTKVGRTYEWGGADYLDDVAQALFELDLRPDLIKPDKQKNNLVTYAVGFADPTLANDPLLMDTASRGGGLFKKAENSTELSAAFKAIMADIGNQVKEGSSASLAANSTQLDATTKIYQAGFNSADWSGSFKAFNLVAKSEDKNANGILDTGEDTNSNNKLDFAGDIIQPAVWATENLMPAAANRHIFTYNPVLSSGNKGVSFAWTNLSDAQKTALDPTLAATATSSAVLDYIRGDRAKESATGYRIRSTILGDIVNSDPLFVGKTEDFGYSLLTSPAGSTYTTFRKNIKSKRANVIYVGANDGMLHAINADTGVEEFAYVPDAVLPKLKKLTDPNYGCNTGGCLPHEYYVDGSARAGDAYFAVGTGSAQWRTVLLGTTAAGSGKSIFALDVTNPVPTSSNGGSSFNANHVLWEISPMQAPKSTDLTDDTSLVPVRLGFANHLGYSIPQPTVVRMQGGVWAAIVANGYNSVNKKAVLYVINIATGEIIRSFDTQKGSTTTPNGLSTPVPIDSDGDLVVDYIYAGDLLGNLWKFDVSDGNSGNWHIAFSSGTVPAPLYAACSDATCTATNYQPITTKPRVGRHPLGGFMVYFGTGKYYEAGDQIVDSTTAIQTFYGIWDKGEPISGKNKLQEQSILAEKTIDSNNDSVNDSIVRVTSDTVVDYSGNSTASPAVPAKTGWFMNLVVVNGTAKGERVVSTPLLRGGRIIFVTLIPSTDSCNSGGSSWIMQFDALNGNRLPSPTFDIDKNGLVNLNDRVNGLLGSAQSSEFFVVSGKQDLRDGKSRGIVKGPTVLTNCGDGDTECNYTSDSSGGKFKDPTPTPEVRGRQSWHQLH